MGVHHAGVLPKYRRIVEELFQEKLLSVAICTETLAAGINLPARSVVLPTNERIANKVTIHPGWPSFSSPEGKAIRYGSECCPRTIDILNRTGGVVMDPNFTDEDLRDIVRAIRKVYTAMGPA